MALAALYRRRHCVCRRDFLVRPLCHLSLTVHNNATQVWMDRIHHFYPLDGTHRSWSRRRLRYGHNLHARMELPLGLISQLVRYPTLVLLLPFADPCSAASAFAANTMLRSLVGACFPLFSKQMFENLGVQWAGTLIGCIATLMIPIPIIFQIYGPKLRQKSRLSPTRA